VFTEPEIRAHYWDVLVRMTRQVGALEVFRQSLVDVRAWYRPTIFVRRGKDARGKFYSPNCGNKKGSHHHRVQALLPTIRAALAAGQSVTVIAQTHGLSEWTIRRIRKSQVH